MAGLTRVTSATKKAKKHGAKAGQKSLIRPSQQKSVKNGRAQPQPKQKLKLKAVKISKPSDKELDAMIESEMEAGFDECEQTIEDNLGD